MTTIIEIAAIRPPKEGKKVATVVSNTGQSFEIWPEKAAPLKIGERYDIELAFVSSTLNAFIAAARSISMPASSATPRTCCGGYGTTHSATAGRPRWRADTIGNGAAAH